jgi:hypothetical protein
LTVSKLLAGNLLWMLKPYISSTSTFEFGVWP